MDDDVTVDFDEDGLVPAVAQDADTGEVLMLAYVSPEALRRTHETGLAHYYSRSRDELWQKGNSSGHVQEIEEVRVDCDADTLLYLVDQAGGACHTGHRSCFYRAVDGVSVSGEGRSPSDRSSGQRPREDEANGGSSTEEVDDVSADDGGAAGGSSNLAVDTAHVGERVFDPDAVYDD